MQDDVYVAGWFQQLICFLCSSRVGLSISWPCSGWCLGLFRRIQPTHHVGAQRVHRTISLALRRNSNSERPNFAWYVLCWRLALCGERESGALFDLSCALQSFLSSSDNDTTGLL